MKKKFYSHGKIMLSGEYVVLDGAWAILLATKKGQILETEKISNNNYLHWKSYNSNKKIWFESIFLSESLKIIYSTNLQISKIIKELFIQVQKIDKNIYLKWNGILIKTYLEFPKNWGLGSSSTLLANLSQWLKIDFYKISNKIFGGSGSDIACSFLGKSILYRLKSSKQDIKPIQFEPSFSEEIFFLYLNRKQNTKSEILNYISKKKKVEIIKRLSDISLTIANCKNFEYFKKLLNEHEELLSSILNTKTLKKKLFKDYPSTIKSLGAWGGDFALIIRTENMKNYFNNKGYYKLFPFKKFILN